MTVERILSTSAGVEPATSWSPVGLQLSHRGRLPVWRNSQFIHIYTLQRCFCKRQRCETNERAKFKNVMAYVIKNLFFFFFFFFFGKIHLFQTTQKNLPNKYFNFGQLLLFSVVNIGNFFLSRLRLTRSSNHLKHRWVSPNPNLSPSGSSYWGATAATLHIWAVANKINKMTYVPRAVTCASAQSDPSSLSARKNLGPLATHWVRSQTDETVTINVNLTLPWVAKSFCWFCHALAHMVKSSEISRPITYKFTGAVVKLLERPLCVPEVVCSIRCQVIPKSLNMILLQLLFRWAISIEQTEMVGLV